MLGWFREILGGGRKVTNDQSQLDVRGLFEKIHRQLLDGQFDETKELGLLQDAKTALMNHPNFVLGSFVYWRRDGKKDFWPIGSPLGSPPIFYSPAYQSNTTFTGRVTAAYNKLSEYQTSSGKGLFLSELIHEESQVKALHIEMVHNNDNSCKDEIHAHSCDDRCGHESKRAIVRRLEQLQELFPDNGTKKKYAKAYAAIIVGDTDSGYFPDTGNYLIAYCPFLVPNGKPPGSFFGVFKCEGKCKKLLPLLTDIQLAGTLIFSRMAVDAQAHRLKDEVEKLRKLYGEIMQVGNIIGNLELIMNPDALIAGTQEWEKIRNYVVNHFTDNLDANGCHTVKDWEATPQCLVRFIDKIKECNTAFAILKEKLGDELYTNYFSDVEILFTGGDEATAKRAAHIIKCLAKGKSCPLVWFFPSVSLIHGIEINSTRSPLSFAIALSICVKKRWVEMLLSDDYKKIEITIRVPKDKSDPKARLENLKEAIIKKIKEPVVGIALYSGSNSSLIALLHVALCSDQSLPTVQNGCLESKLTYTIGENGK